MSSAYDNWLAHDPREDGPEPMCQLCQYALTSATCCNEASPLYNKSIDAEDSCPEFEYEPPYSAEDIGDRKYHERVDREEGE
jgi:hypothetical protein